MLVTTSGFTRGAREFVRGIPRPIALIDGPELARLMIAHVIAHGVGVKEGRTTGIKEVDMDYFERQGHIE
jgi:restriction system protein